MIHSAIGIDNKNINKVSLDDIEEIKKIKAEADENQKEISEDIVNNLRSRVDAIFSKYLKV